MSAALTRDSATPGRRPDAPLLEATGLKKHYGGVKALDGVQFDLVSGEVHALVGENGAGKSTFVKILAGLVSPDEGQLLFEGDPFVPHAKTTRIAVVHQELTIIPDLSVLDNVLLGHPGLGFPYRRAGYRKSVTRHLEAVGLPDVELDAKARELSLAERQLVEIARAVHRDARIMVLDEPTATLTDLEIERVFAAVRRLRDGGHGIIYISHRLKEIFELSDRVTTFRNGRLVATDRTADIDMSRLVSNMIGRQPAKPLARYALGEAPGAPLTCDGLTLPGVFEDISLTIEPGELVAFVGQLGSGADEVVRTLAGLNPGYLGEVKLGDQPVELRSVRRALAEGVAYVSNDRAREGVFLELPVEVNISSAALDRVSSRGVMRRREEKRLARSLAERYQIDIRRLGNATRELSGGNQQKVALAKAAAVAPRVFLLNEPTRGVDIGARAEIYGHLRRMADAGTPIALFTSDLAEALELCDRIVALFRGRVVRVTDANEVDQSELWHAILHPEGAREVA